MDTYVNKSPYKLGQFGKQLANMTEQEVFNISCEHLLLQNKKSFTKKYGCAYDGGNVCCAAAPFILNYCNWMEDCCWEDIACTENCLELIEKLQGLHDKNEPEFWASKLQELADDSNLALPKILKESLAIQ